MPVRSVLSIFLILALFNVQASAGRFYIKGTIVRQAADGQFPAAVYMYKLVSVSDYLSYDPGLLVDSAEIGKDGTFVFRNGKVISHDTFYGLALAKGKNKDNGTRRPENATYDVAYLLLQPDSKIEFRTELSKFNQALKPIRMDAPNLSLRHVYDLCRPMTEAIDSESARNRNANGTTDSLAFISDRCYRLGGMLIWRAKAMVPVIDTLSNHAISLFAFIAYRPFFDSVFCLKMNSRYQREIPHSPYAGQLADFIYDYFYTLPVGSIAPVVSLPDSAGRLINTGSLKGKYILLDFWASWCHPCRMENHDFIKPLYQQYGNRNFYVLSISMDTDKDKWKDAVRTDSLGWPGVVCDGQGVNSPAAKAYRVTDVPVNYIIGPDGLIIAKNLHGRELTEFISARVQDK